MADSLICVTTNQCPPVIGTSQSTDAAQLIDWRSGAVITASGGSSALKVGNGIGIQSLSKIPLALDHPNQESMYIAYGGKGRNDMNAFLIIQGSPTSPKWKCRLPEIMSKAGLVVSPCGQYIFGAGKSGKCYCWSIFCEGELKKVWTAHNRAVEAMVFSDCGSYLVTGGADGIVNLWSIMEIVANDQGASSFHRPIRTWSEHHLPVSAMHSLPSSRVVSTSRDRQVVIMELFSGKTLAKISMPSSINSITADASGHQLYFGSQDGTIFSVDLDCYAIATNAESATVVKGDSENVGQFLGKKEDREGSSGNGHSYISELRGHRRSVSCLSIIDDEDKLLVSGSEDGSVRMWDIQSRCCARVFYPWSSKGASDESSSNQIVSPCTDMAIIPRGNNTIGRSNDSFLSSTEPRHRKKGDSISDVVSPLQMYPKVRDRKEKDLGESIICISDSRKDGFMLNQWSNFVNYDIQDNKPRKRMRETMTTGSTDKSETTEIDLLREQLAAAKDENERWKKVNNKLMQKIKSSEIVTG